MKAYEIIFDSNSKETKRVELDITKLKRQKDPSTNRNSTLWLLDIDVANKMSRVLYPSQIVFE